MGESNTVSSTFGFPQTGSAITHDGKVATAAATSRRAVQEDLRRESGSRPPGEEGARPPGDEEEEADCAHPLMFLNQQIQQMLERAFYFY